MELPEVAARDSPIHGRGVVAVRPIAAGTVVWRARDGRVLTAAEHRRLTPELRGLAYRRGDGFVLEPEPMRWVNHSCDPNLAWAGDDAMIARRDIASGEELTYDYATSEAHPWWRAKWRCGCGAADCRGSVSGRDCLAPGFRARHDGHLPSWTVAFIRRQRGLRGLAGRALFAAAEVVRALRGRHAGRART